MMHPRSVGLKTMLRIRGKEITKSKMVDRASMGQKPKGGWMNVINQRISGNGRVNSS